MAHREIMSAWRRPAAQADAKVFNGSSSRTGVKSVKRCLIFISVADGLYINEKSIPPFLNRFEPLTVLSEAGHGHPASGTCVGTLSTVKTASCFTTARQFASLDHLSQ